MEDREFENENPEPGILRPDTGRVVAVCVSEKKGTQKTPVVEVRLVADWGIEGDAHAGRWHRQVSLLARESIQKMIDKGLTLDYGDFGENIVCEGIPLVSLPIGTRLRVGETLLEVSQIGKECVNRCAIYYLAGDCIMPKEGVFARVVEGGVVRPGDGIIILGFGS